MIIIGTAPGHNRRAPRYWVQCPVCKVNYVLSAYPGCIKKLERCASCFMKIRVPRNNNTKTWETRKARYGPSGRR
jgi:hypothetical protein